jgi:hypothetical protein
MVRMCKIIYSNVYRPNLVDCGLGNIRLGWI